MATIQPEASDAESCGPSTDDILSCIADAVISTDQQGRILLFNPAAENLFGYSADEMLGKSIQVLLPPRFRDVHARALAGFGAAPSDLARAMAGEREVFGLRSNGAEFRAEARLSRRFIGENALLTVIVRDISHRIALDEQRDLVAAEMAHRFKNIMSVVSAVIALTARSVSSVEEFRLVLQDRLSSISRSQEALRDPFNDIQLVELAEGEMAPFRHGAVDRIMLQGPEVTIPPALAVSVSLVLHELATNAVKYGALSDGEGSVALSWSTLQEGEVRFLVLDWLERGGPPVEPPVRRGFGSDLIGRCFGPSSSVVEYDPAGLMAHFRIRL